MPRGKPSRSHLERPLAARPHARATRSPAPPEERACGDLVRVSAELDPASPEGVITDAGFDACGCGAARRRRQRRGRARPQARRCCAPLASAPSRSRRSSAGSRRRSATPPSSPPTPCIGRSAPPPGRAPRLAPTGGRDARRDERRRRQRGCGAPPGARASGEVVGVTLELWSRRRERRRAQLLLGARRARRARARSPPRHAAPLDRPARGVPRGRGRALARRTTRAGSRRIRACAATAACASTRCSRCADRLGAAALATGHYARVRRTAETRCSRCLRRRREGSELRARRRSRRMTLAQLRFPLGELDEGARCARSPREAGLEVARKPDSQDLCFLAGTDQRRAFSRATAASRPRAGRSSTPGGARLGEHPAISASPSVSATGSASAAARRGSCSRPTRARTPSPSARASRCSRARSSSRM